MIEKKAKSFEVSFRNQVVVYLSTFVLFIFTFLFEVKLDLFLEIGLYIRCSLIMLVLFVRVDSLPKAYYWIKSNGFSKLLLIKFTSPEIPARFYIANIYFYAQVIIVILLYIFFRYTPSEISIDFDVFNYYVIAIFNMIPALIFVIVEVIESRKCKNVKLF